VVDNVLLHRDVQRVDGGIAHRTLLPVRKKLTAMQRKRKVHEFESNEFT
jgi:hypothetical protein